MNEDNKDSMIGVLNKNSLELVSLTEDRETKGTLSNVIHVTNEFTEVTNGFYAMRISNKKIHISDYPTGPNKEKISTKEINVIIPADIANRIKKNLPKIDSIPGVENAIFSDNTIGDNIEVITYDLRVWNRINFKSIKSEFPNIDNVTPEKQASIEVNFDPNYMIKLCQQFKKNGVKSVRLSIYSPTEAMMMSARNPETSQDIMVLLMPKSLK